MPLPKPRSGESHNDFISRCHSELEGEFPDLKQRHAICETRWRDRNKSDPLVALRGQIDALKKRVVLLDNRKPQCYTESRKE